MPICDLYTIQVPKMKVNISALSVIIDLKTFDKVDDTYSLSARYVHWEEIE